MRVQLASLNFRVVFLFVMAFVLYASPALIYRDNLFITSPDVATFITSAENVMQTGSFVIEDSWNERYGTYGFHLRGMDYIPGKGVVQLYPPGFSLLLAFLGTILLGNLVYVVPLIGAFGVVIFYYLVRDLLGEHFALGSSILLLVLPGYWYWSTYAVADVPSVVCMLLILLVVSRGLQRDSLWAYAAAGSLLGFWVWLRYSNLIMFPALGVYLWLQRGQLRRIQNALVGLGMIALFGTGLAFYHLSVYGNPFSTGYTYSSLQAAGSAEAADADVVGVKRDISELGKVVKLVTLNSSRLLDHVVHFPLQARVAIPYVLLSLIGLVSLSKRRPELCVFIVLLLLSLVCYFGNNYFYGYEQRDLILSSSYLRYLLPTWVLLVIPAYAAIEKIAKRGSRRAMCLILLVLSSIAGNFGAVSQNLLYDLAVTLPSAVAEKNGLMALTRSGGIVFVSRVDKYRLADRVPFVFYDSKGVVPVREMLRVTDLLVKDGKDVYFVADPRPPTNRQREQLAGTVTAYLKTTDHKLMSNELGLYRILGVSPQGGT